MILILFLEFGIDGFAVTRWKSKSWGIENAVIKRCKAVLWLLERNFKFLFYLRTSKQNSRPVFFYPEHVSSAPENHLLSFQVFSWSVPESIFVIIAFYTSYMLPTSESMSNYYFRCYTKYLKAWLSVARDFPEMVLKVRSCSGVAITCGEFSFVPFTVTNTS